jgi:hypothetical protein
LGSIFCVAIKCRSNSRIAPYGILENKGLKPLVL